MHVHTQKKMSHYPSVLNEAALIPETNNHMSIYAHEVYEHTHTFAHTQRHTQHFIGLFLKVEEAINGILLNHKTRVKFSPLH